MTPERDIIPCSVEASVASRRTHGFDFVRIIVTVAESFGELILVRATEFNMEVEVIEQIKDEPLGRSAGWVCDFLNSLGHSEPFVVLHGMWRGGYLLLADAGGKQLPRWQSEQILRDGVQDSEAQLLATNKGAKWAHGPSA